MTVVPIWCGGQLGIDAPGVTMVGIGDKGRLKVKIGMTNDDGCELDASWRRDELMPKIGENDGN